MNTAAATARYIVGSLTSKGSPFPVIDTATGATVDTSYDYTNADAIAAEYNAKPEAASPYARIQLAIANPDRLAGADALVQIAAARLAIGDTVTADRLTGKAAEMTPTLRQRADANRRALRRLECESHRYATAYCNGPTDDASRYALPWRHWSSYTDAATNRGAGWVDLANEDDRDAYEAMIARRVVALIGTVPGLFVNTDARGYALKVQPDHAADLTTDWGGYGILAPERN